QTILVIGASGLGKPVSEVVHRPHIFTRLTGSELASPEAVALAIEKENLGDRIFINQSDLAQENAMILADLMQKPGLVGSIQKGEILCLF
ncbi:MAG: putative selenium-dependent hydroxylase accessory protein YqeC, partial [Oscillospiraceae bacterium]|nr:putative selenium-dependent hydroxylase accessory protein YqeC [Oscillospiraceae bacterium]